MVNFEPLNASDREGLVAVNNPQVHQTADVDGRASLGPEPRSGI